MQAAWADRIIGTETLIAHSLSADGFDASEDGTGRGVPMVPVAICTAHTQIPMAAVSPMIIAHTLESGGGAQAVAFNLRGREGGALPEMSETASLRAASTGGSSNSYVAFSAKDYGADVDEIAPTLRGMGHDASHANGGGQVAVAWSGELTASTDIAGTLQRGGEGGRADGVMTPQMAVRRLTPRECERLQGFPDDYTLVEYRGKLAADGPRYKLSATRWLSRSCAGSGTHRSRRCHPP